ncbi:DNAJA5 [Mytilus edulis]|uniref:DNAJA5 n=1 Tax=Mytilus edulis TaxID=6550 RepID=A0A8S3PPS8_MYTED|nr:DNAJA5 [Mytilus edulis]
MSLQEVLCVERDASEDLKAYRKLALNGIQKAYNEEQLDRKSDNIEECTAQFRIVQQAYDVLIDPQERAWYDKHQRLFFEGFYAVYTEVFKVIAEEDKTFMDDDEEYEEHPEFGDSKSVYEEVLIILWPHFMGLGKVHCTAKSYVWVEKYDTREAPDRRCRRLMEAENKKLRRLLRKIGMRKHFEDYKENSFSAAHEAELAQLESNLAEHFGKNRTMKMTRAVMKMIVTTIYADSCDKEVEEEEYYDDLFCYLFMLFSDEEDYYDDNSCDEEEEEEEYYDDLFCVACNKYVNHEKSKKHKEGVAFLKEEMKESGDGIDRPLTLNEDEDSDEEEITSSKYVDDDDLVESTSSLTVNDKEEDENKVKQRFNKTAEECQPESVTDSEHKDVDQNEDRLKADLPQTNGVIAFNECSTETEVKSQNKHENIVKDWKCNVCSVNFPTRNKLFGHIKESGHALRVEEGTADSGKGKKNKKKGKR